MTLDQWVLERVEASNGMATADSVLRDLATRADVSYVTVYNTFKGARMGLYVKARAVSKATGWKVSIPSLCGDSDITAEIRSMFA